MLINHLLEHELYRMRRAELLAKAERAYRFQQIMDEYAQPRTSIIQRLMQMPSAVMLLQVVRRILAPVPHLLISGYNGSAPEVDRR